MVRYFVVSLVGGLLFGVLDGVINANPFARDLFAVYQPIARTSINVPAGVAIDLAYGFALAVMYLVLAPSLPGSTGLTKGLSFAAGLWFLRVVMSAASTWMTFNVPLPTIGYGLAAGFAEMAVLGVFYGVTLGADG